MMLTELASTAYAHPGWGDGPGPWNGGPGWWLVFPILFWVIILSTVGYLFWRRNPTRSARTSAEHILTARYARGEIDEDELRQRRGVLRGRA